MSKAGMSEQSLGARAGLRHRIGRLAIRVERVPGLPLVALRTWLVAGSRLEPTPGLSLVTGRLLGEGTATRDWSRWATDVEDRGMTLQTTGSAETLGIALDALAEDAELAMDWLAELLLEPAFTGERLHWIRQQAAAELEGLLDQPDFRTGRAYLQQLYHPHPYSRPLQGSRADLDRIESADCRAFYRSAQAWGGCLVVVGDIDESAALKHLQDRLDADFPKQTATPPAVPDITGSDDLRRELVVGGRDQAHLFLGHLTVPRAHPDRIPLELAGVMLGAGPGMAGRLPFRIREQEGLAYAVDIATAAGAGLEPGRLTIYVATSPDQVAQAERAAREELARALGDGFSDDEFESARSFLLGREPFRRETLRQRADRLAEAEVYGLPSDRAGWIESVLRDLDRPTVEAALRRWVRPDDLRVTVGLPKT